MSSNTINILISPYLFSTKCSTSRTLALLCEPQHPTSSSTCPTSSSAQSHLTASVPSSSSWLPIWVFDEMEYTPMLVWISVACFVAAVVYKLINECGLLSKHHTMIVVWVFSVAMLFTKGITSQTILLIILNLFVYILQIVSFICVAITLSSEQLSLWTTFAQDAYALGSLVASMLTGLLSYLHGICWTQPCGAFLLNLAIT